MKSRGWPAASSSWKVASPSSSSVTRMAPASGSRRMVFSTTMAAFSSFAVGDAASRRRTCDGSSFSRALFGYRVARVLNNRSARVRSSDWPNSQKASAARTAPCHSESSPYWLAGNNWAMSSYAPTRTRARSSRGLAGEPAPCASISFRSVVSRFTASRNNAVAFDPCADVVAVRPKQIAAITMVRLQPAPTDNHTSTKLGIDFFKVVLVYQHLARLSAGAGRDEPFCFHHVHQAGGAAEADAQFPLQIRDRHLAAADNDARGLVIEIVLLELQALRGRLLVFSRDRIVEDRLTLFA